MRAFCVKVAAWVLALALFGVVSVGINRIVLPAHGRMLTPDETRVLVLGDSHAASGLDPALWDGGVNLARNGEPLLATYYKMKFVAAQNPSVESVVLSFGPANIGAANGHRWEDPTQTDYLMRGLIGFTPLWQIEGASVGTTFAVHLRHWWTPNGHMIEDWLALRRGVPVRTHTYAIGFWDHVTTSVLTDEALEDVIYRQYEMHGPGIARQELAYLDSIVDWTARTGRDLTVVSLPLHERYRARVPDPIMAAFDSIRADLDARDGVRALDFHTLALPDSAWRDFDHLNVYGIPIMTEALDEALGARR